MESMALSNLSVAYITTCDRASTFVLIQVIFLCVTYKTFKRVGLSFFNYQIVGIFNHFWHSISDTFGTAWFLWRGLDCGSVSSVVRV